MWRVMKISASQNNSPKDEVSDFKAQLTLTWSTKSCSKVNSSMTTLSWGGVQNSCHASIARLYLKLSLRVVLSKITICPEFRISSNKKQNLWNLCMKQFPGIRDKTLHQPGVILMHQLRLKGALSKQPCRQRVQAKIPFLETMKTLPNCPTKTKLELILYRKVTAVKKRIFRLIHSATTLELPSRLFRRWESPSHQACSNLKTWQLVSLDLE